MMCSRPPILAAIILAGFAGAWFTAASLQPPTPRALVLPREQPASLSAARAELIPLAATDAPADPFDAVGYAAEEEPLPSLPPPPEPEVAPAPLMAFRLTGVVTGEARRAILEGSNTAYVAREGDEIEGWIVTKIGTDSVTLRAPSGDEVAIELEPAPSIPPGQVVETTP